MMRNDQKTAGELAVNIYEYMLREKWLAADGLALTSAGKTQLERPPTA